MDIAYSYYCNLLTQVPIYCHGDGLFRELAGRHKTAVMKKVAEALCDTALRTGEAEAMETVLSSITVLYQSGDSKASSGLPLRESLWWCHVTSFDFLVEVGKLI